MTDRESIMRVLRDNYVPDAIIAKAFGLTRQRIGAIMGPANRPRERQPESIKIDLAKIPDRLYRFRTRHDLTQSRAAELIGVHVMTWYLWEAGTTAPSLPILLLKYIDHLDSTLKPKNP